MQIWMGIVLLGILFYLGFDYGRLWLKSRRLEEELGDTDYTPMRYIMIGTNNSDVIADLSSLDIQAHKKAGVKIVNQLIQPNKGFIKVWFENGDELIVYEYGVAQIQKLSKHEKKCFVHKIFFDHMLPEGAERAVIKQLDLVDYMVNIGICSERSKNK